MKRKGLLINAGEAEVKNIGDYIQSLAQAQFIGKWDELVEREKLNELSGDTPIKVVMNAWFMRHSECFPPSEIVEPLFISFHVTPKIENEFFNDAVVEYLKQHEPIGCRDYCTLEMMKKYGIDAYFSGCLTLTLGANYGSSVKDGKACFVDPYYEYGPGCSGRFKHLKTLALIGRYFFKLRKFADNFNSEFISMLYKISPKLNQLGMAACFYHTYKNFFSDEIIFDAEYINHQVVQKNFGGDKAKLEYAEALVKKYAKSKLVVTSRLHCALPCLGVETPVIFVSSEKLNGDSIRSSGRFGGLKELLNTVTWTSNGLVTESNAFKDTALQHEKCNYGNIPKNTDRYRHLAENLKSKVVEFLRS